MDKIRLIYGCVHSIISIRKGLMVWIGIQEAFYRSGKEKCAYDDQGDAGEKEGARSYLCTDSGEVRPAGGNGSESARRDHPDTQSGSATAKKHLPI